MNINESYDCRLLPEAICELRNLSRIDVSGNELILLPNEVSGLINLKYINFADNKIEHFPYYLGCLPSLDIIICNRNPFKNVEKEFTEQPSRIIIQKMRQNVFKHQENLEVDDRYNLTANE